MEIESLSSSISIPESLHNQNTFDSLLRVLNKTPKKTKKVELNQSTELLIAEEEGKGVENLAFSDTPIPIPKPRKNKKRNDAKAESKESSASDGTYEVRSPVVVKDVNEKESINGLFNKRSEFFIHLIYLKFVFVQKIDDNDAATYTKSPDNNCDKHFQAIGDILVHSNVTSPVIPIVNQHHDKSKDDDDKSSIFVVETQDKDETEAVIRYGKSDEKAKDKISYENEVEPKPTKHKKRANKEIKSEEELPKYTFENITAVTIHRTDRLQLSSLVIHPLVCIHVINSQTGDYLKKSDKNRAVTFYYENKKFDYISPILTQAYNMRKERSLVPQWEETLIFNEDFTYILEQHNSTIFFFEVIDFLTYSESNIHHHSKQSSVGWHKIAWAFLKPIGKRGHLNVNKRVRLQLYKPLIHIKNDTNRCDVFLWWQKRTWVKYPASLHVTVKSIPLPQNAQEGMRSKTPVMAEVGSKNVFDEKQKDEPKGPEKTGQKVKWTKMEYHTCKLSNKCLEELETCEEGAFVVKFSNGGKFLAVAVVLNGVYTIKVFEVETWRIHSYIPAHQGLIYNIIWSIKDDIILSSSADGTASLWDFEKNHFIQMLPHPSFVYACSINEEKIVATGCYDKVIRIWQKSKKYILKQELEAHKGYVTSLVFNKKGNILFSSDSIGIVLAWNKCDQDWCLKRTIKLADLQSTTINQILLCKKEKTIVIHARDSILRIADIETATVLHWLQGAANNRIHTKCSLSSCGNFVTCGSENGVVLVWNVYNEKCIATYTPCGKGVKHFTVHDVQFHPSKNMIAFAHYGSNLPVFVYAYVEVNVSNTEVKRNEYISKPVPSSRLGFSELLCKIDKLIHDE